MIIIIILCMLQTDLRGKTQERQIACRGKMQHEIKSKPYIIVRVHQFNKLEFWTIRFRQLLIFCNLRIILYF